MTGNTGRHVGRFVTARFEQSTGQFDGDDKGAPVCKERLRPDHQRRKPGKALSAGPWRVGRGDDGIAWSDWQG